MVDGLKVFQTEISPYTVYEAAYKPRQVAATKNSSPSQLRPNIQVAGYAADVYGSQFAPDNAPVGMTKLFDGLLGIAAFTVIPNYLYVSPVDDNPTAIILSSVTAEAVV